MFVIEAQHIANWLRGSDLSRCDRILSIASGNLAMRTVHQPFLDQVIFQPLAKREVACLHHEFHPGLGVDISGDLTKAETYAALRALQPTAVFAFNVLEHVDDLPAVCRQLSSLLPPGGWLALTVPRSFQYHADPIDSYFRPSPAELIALFPELGCVHQETIRVESMWSEMGAGGGLGTTLWRLGRHAWRMLSFFNDRPRWLSHVHSTLWLLRTRKVSFVVLRKAAAGAVPSR